jgi:hypothetical protein
MSPRSAGLALAVLGILVTLLFALADVIGVGNPARFGYIQIAGTVVGALIFIAGLVIYLRQSPG